MLMRGRSSDQRDFETPGSRQRYIGLTAFDTDMLSVLGLEVCIIVRFINKKTCMT